ncbi:disulfide bond formation protein B [Pontixanthobacter gangjinensis]
MKYMTENHSLKLAQRLALAVPALLLGGAYISQYGFGLYPCEMCWWQRWPHFAALGFATLSFFAPSKALLPKTMLTALAAIAVIISGLIGGFHAGVEYDWWEGITGCATTIQDTGGNALDAIMNAPLVRCDVSPWDFMGVSLAGWNFLISVSVGLIILGLLARVKGKQA